jgi:HEAT repeat protein
MRVITILTAGALATTMAQAPNEPAQQPSAVKADIERLIAAAEKLTGTWPSQPPPPVPEVALVARHGKQVTPLLLELMSDDPAIERDRRRWQVQQQAALTLCEIYAESDHCGRTYCDGDPAERIGHVKSGWIAMIAADAALHRLSAEELLERFQHEPVFWRQFEIAKALAAAGDRRIVPSLQPWLTHQDRHLRGNAAFVLAGLGDARGFPAITGILADRSDRPPAQGIPGGRWTVEGQIRADRYYAAHLLGDLKDPRCVELLVPLLGDKDVHAIVPWSLGQIGDRRAIPPLLSQLDEDDPSTRVLAILALQALKAREALPRLNALLRDTRPSNFGDLTTVANAAKRAMAVISAAPGRGGM